MYIVQKVGHDDEAVIVSDKRPTMIEIRAHGEGGYLMRRDDGSVIKTYRVTRNRKGSLSIEGFTPTGISGIKTLHLQRMLKAYSVIVKYDTSKEREVARIDHEIVQRQEAVMHALADDAQRMVTALSLIHI